ncbi:hypothetical protein DNU06_13405 [Putridiphycobacter roseus]|uniref:Uncharacterized protein n=1 Tax=Putridiphycobacter roseus TaxID=2219161 RepID=A0A2W1NAH7_9FLAO|nr:hypothetical protein DNU06_13405 [Putridiphycobacter roseus]
MKQFYWKTSCALVNLLRLSVLANIVLILNEVRILARAEQLPKLNVKGIFLSYVACAINSHYAAPSSATTV